MLASYFRFLLRIALGTLLVLGAVVGIGLLLDEKHAATRETVLAAPPPTVWATITDFSNAPNLRPGLSRVDVLPPVNGLPAWREVERSGKAISYAVTESQPPSRLVVRLIGDDQPFAGVWTYELTPAGSGTRLRLTENGEIYHPVFRFVFHLFLNQAATIEQYLGALEARHGKS
jgi:uncharacterized protein YndB with AHSA1/START domain